MPQTLTGLRELTALALDDPAGVRFSEQALTASIRLALGEYNLLQAALRRPLAEISGLDGAAQTSLPAAHESLIVEGAAGYAAALKAAGRSEICGLEKTEVERMAAWSACRLAAFRRMLEEVEAEVENQRLAGLRTAGSGVISPAGWPVDAWEGQP